MSSEGKSGAKAGAKATARAKSRPKAALKPRIAVFKFASCDGCQLSLLDAEDELLAIAGAVDIAYFPEASRTMLKGPYDIGFVEGSITTHHDAQRRQEVRLECKKLEGRRRVHSSRLCHSAIYQHTQAVHAHC
jgi:hypothetical protein